MNENDYFLNLLSNPSFTPQLFKDVGLTSNNTSIESRDRYKNSDVIKSQPMFLDEKGNFDEGKFDKFYDAARSGYGELTNLLTNDDISDLWTFYKDNITVPESQRNMNPEFKIERVDNPLRLKLGFINFGINETPEHSVRENAEKQPVWDTINKKWIDTPEDTPFDNFINPKVLASWDFDADANGKPTKDPNKIVHHKGELKTNYNGTYYYETLGNRSPYGKQVLSGFDTLTKEGTAANKIDFLDSDDRLKSIPGAMFKAAAMVVPALIGGPISDIYVGARVMNNLTELLPTVGKIFTGSDNSFLSKLEAWNLATTFSQSDYVQGSAEEGTPSHMLSMETAFNLVSSTFAQLAEQRWLFKYGTKLFSGVNPKIINGTDEEKAALTKEYVTNYLKEHPNNWDEVVKKSKDLLDLLTKGITVLAMKERNAMNALKSQIDKGLNIGKQLSMAYMTGITTAGAYGEAKDQGATDTEAALYTLGYTAAEWGLLNTELGNWIMPELKMGKMTHKGIAKGLANISKEFLESGKTDLDKVKWWTKLANFGKGILKGDYSDSVAGNTAKMAVSHMLGEGFEEVSEDLLQDFSRALSNVIQGTNLKPWDDGWQSLYLMDFVGGVVGGGIANGLPGFLTALNIKLFEKTPEEAYKAMVDIVQQGQAGDFLKTVDKMTFANKHLSSKTETDSNGNVIFKNGTNTDNMDLDVKNRIHELVAEVLDILESEGANISNDSLINDKLLRREFKYQFLRDSQVLGVYTTDFNNVCSKLVKAILDLKTEEGTGLTDSQESKAKKEGKLDEEKLKRIKELKDNIKTYRDEILKYNDGTKSEEFLLDALFEMDLAVSGPYVGGNNNFYRWAEDKTGKSYKDISDNELDNLKKEFTDALITRKYLIHEGRKVFSKNLLLYANILKKYHLDYFLNRGKAMENLEAIVFGRESQMMKTPETTMADLVQSEIGGNLSPLQLFFLRVFIDAMQGKIDSKYLDKLKEVLERKVTVAQKVGAILPESFDKFNGLSDEIKNKVQELIGPLNEGTTDETYNQAIKNYDKLETAKLNDDFLRLLSAMFRDLLVQQEFVNNINKAKYILPTVKLALNDFIGGLEITGPDKNKLKSEVNKMPDSPISELLGGITMTMRSQGINVSLDVTDLAKLLSNLSKSMSVSSFNYNKDVEDRINEAIDLIDVAAAHVEASKTDIDATIGNLFGYNATVNEIHQKRQKEGRLPKSENENFEELPLIDNDSANSILKQLSDYRKDLMFYKKLYASNSNTVLTEHDRASILVHKSYMKNLLRFVISVPEIWKDKDKLLLAVNDAKLLNSLLDDTKTSLNSDEKVQLAKERINISKAIYLFFQTNKDLLNDTNALSDLFSSLNLINGKQTSITADVKSESDMDFLMHIALYAAVDLEALYLRYKNVISADYAPVIGLEEAIMRATSFYLNPKVFELFAKAYNLLYKLLYDEYRKNNPLDALDSGYNTERFLNSYRSFFIEGDPGSGKSTAVLTTVVRIIKNINENALKNVWVVSNTKENATKLAKSIGLDEAQTMGAHESNEGAKDGYMDKIAIDYQQKYTDSGTVEMDQKDYVRNEDGIPEYKNIKPNLSIKAPLLVIIDEATSLSLLDVRLNEKFMEHNGIYAIMSGDFSLLGALGSYEDKERGVTTYADMRITNYMHSWKLGQILRSNNLLKSNNIIKTREFIQDLANNITSRFNGEDFVPLRLSLQYHEEYDGDNKGLYGDKVVSFTDDEEYTRSIVNMLQSLNPGEKLNYIYNDKNSALYQKMQDLNKQAEYKDKINFVTSGASQGQEGQYYVIDLGTDYLALKANDNTLTENDALVYAKSLYTGLSRAKQASLIITDNCTVEDNDGLPYTDSILDESIDSINSDLIKWNLSKQQIESYAISRKDTLDKAIGKELLPLEIIRDKIETPTEELKEEPPITSDEEQQGKKETEELNITDIPEISNDSDDEVNMMIHTMMNQETGCTVTNENPNEDPYDPMAEHAVLHLGEFHDERVDNLNGLVKILETGKDIGIHFAKRRDANNIEVDMNVTGDTLSGSQKEEYLKILNRIRNIATYEPDINLVHDQICKELGLTLHKDRIRVDYIFKSSMDNSSEDNLKAKLNLSGPKTRFRKFWTGIKEWVSSIFNKSNTNEEIHEPVRLKYAIVISNAETGKHLLEVPLATMTSPLTMLNTKGFEGLKAIWDSDSINHNVESFIDDLRSRIESGTDTTPHLNAMYKMMRIYNTYKDKVVYFKHGTTLALNAKITGIQTIGIGEGRERGKDYFFTPAYYYKADWMDLSEYKKKMPWRTISLVYVDIDSKLLTYDGKEANEKGNPFVLMTDYMPNSTVPSDQEMWNLYIKLCKNPDEPKYVRKVYVSPPMTSIEQYLYNLNLVAKKYNKRKGTELEEIEIDHLLGNKLTNFRLLQFMLKDGSKFRDAIQKNIDSQDPENKEKAQNRLNTITNIVNYLSDLEKDGTHKDIVTILKKKVSNTDKEFLDLFWMGKYRIGNTDWLVSTVLGYELRNLLYSPLYNNVPLSLLHVNYSPELVDNKIKFLDFTLDRVNALILDAQDNGWKGVLYHISVKRRTDDTSTYLEGSYGSEKYSLNLASLDGLSISGKQLLINGKLDSTAIVKNNMPNINIIYAALFDEDPNTFKPLSESQIKAISAIGKTERYVKELPFKSDSPRRSKFQSKIGDKLVSKTEDINSISNLLETLFNLLSEQNKLNVLKDPRLWITDTLGSNIIVIYNNSKYSLYNLDSANKVVYLPDTRKLIQGIVKMSNGDYMMIQKTGEISSINNLDDIKPIINMNNKPEIILEIIDKFNKPIPPETVDEHKWLLDNWKTLSPSSKLDFDTKMDRFLSVDLFLKLIGGQYGETYAPNGVYNWENLAIGFLLTPRSDSWEKAALKYGYGSIENVKLIEGFKILELYIKKAVEGDADLNKCALTRKPE